MNRDTRKKNENGLLSKSAIHIIFDNNKRGGEWVTSMLLFMPFFFPFFSGRMPLNFTDHIFIIDKKMIEDEINRVCVGICVCV